MTVPRLDPAVTGIQDGRVLIAGGDDTATSPQASAELYDAIAGTFTATGSMTTPRSGLPHSCCRMAPCL